MIYRTKHMYGDVLAMYLGKFNLYDKAYVASKYMVKTEK